ncbi:hypothetical protein AKG39_18220 [Acetobacterium bakii]|uniref:Uncharacterized protein n=1 Tax=Acetobacterium bakii TaxID=52689 RepID=A0A0L6TVN2_9FIRM|nr:hypothetical protein AKG39_18220 [Acetobacterium bakii]
MQNSRARYWLRAFFSLVYHINYGNDVKYVGKTVIYVEHGYLACFFDKIISVSKIAFKSAAD